MTSITINLTVDLDAKYINSQMFVDGADVGLFEFTTLADGTLMAIIAHFEKLKIRVAQAVPSDQPILEANPKLAPVSARPVQLDQPAQLDTPSADNIQP